MNYLNASHRLSYNFIFAGVLLILYELIILLFPKDNRITNAVDSWFQILLELIPNGFWIISIVVILVGLYAIIIEMRSETGMKIFYFPIMFLESLMWAVLIYFNLGLWLSNWLTPELLNNQIAETENMSLLQEIGLSLGAGFYEELLFRVIMTRILLLILPFLELNFPILSKFIVAIITAALFSIAHFNFIVGPYGDSFDIYKFIFRFIFGLIMSALVITRGFGIAAWSHALYDIFVFVGRIL